PYGGGIGKIDRAAGGGGGRAPPPGESSALEARKAGGVEEEIADELIPCIACVNVHERRAHEGERAERRGLGWCEVERRESISHPGLVGAGHVLDDRIQRDEQHVRRGIDYGEWVVVLEQDDLGVGRGNPEPGEGCGQVLADTRENAGQSGSDA